MIEEDIKQKLQEIQQLEAELIDKKKAIRAAGIAQAQAIIDSLDIDVSELRFKSMGEGHVRVVAKTRCCGSKSTAVPKVRRGPAAAVSRVGSLHCSPKATHLRNLPSLRSNCRRTVESMAQRPSRSV